MKTTSFNIKVYKEAAPTVEKILINAVSDFQRIITQEAQNQGHIAEPAIKYDKSTHTLIIEQYPEDKGMVVIKGKEGLNFIPYNKVDNNGNYAQLDPTKGCYRVFVKRAKGIDHPVNVALTEDQLFDIFDKITHSDLTEEEKALSEPKGKLEVVKS